MHLHHPGSCAFSHALLGDSYEPLLVTCMCGKQTGSGPACAAALSTSSGMIRICAQSWTNHAGGCCSPGSQHQMRQGRELLAHPSVIETASHSEWPIMWDTRSRQAKLTRHKRNQWGLACLQAHQAPTLRGSQHHLGKLQGQLCCALWIMLPCKLERAGLIAQV